MVSIAAEGVEHFEDIGPQLHVPGDKRVVDVEEDVHFART
jgi:hypothetical protein